MKPSGWWSYESAWRVHVAPRWSRTAIADVRYSDVAAWVAKLSAKLSASIVATVYSVLARVLDDAVRDRLLASNPARGVKLAKRPPRRNVYLSVAQLHRLADESGRYRSAGAAGVRCRRARADRRR